MSADNQNESSPFSALSYREQQDRWLEWRSRQLEYREGNVKETEHEKPADENPPVTLPRFERAAQTHHHNLDRVLARHSQAGKNHSAFQGVTSSTSGSGQ